MDILRLSLSQASSSGQVFTHCLMNPRSHVSSASSATMVNHPKRRRQEEPEETFALEQARSEMTYSPADAPALPLLPFMAHPGSLALPSAQREVQLQHAPTGDYGEARAGAHVQDMQVTVHEPPVHGSAPGCGNGEQLPIVGRASVLEQEAAAFDRITRAGIRVSQAYWGRNYQYAAKRDFECCHCAIDNWSWRWFCRQCRKDKTGWHHYVGCDCWGCMAAKQHPGGPPSA